MSLAKTSQTSSSGNQNAHKPADGLRQFLGQYAFGYQQPQTFLNVWEEVLGRFSIPHQ
jgi:hypothetical protein